MVVDVRMKCANLCVWHIVGGLQISTVTTHGSAICGAQVSWLPGIRCLESIFLQLHSLYHGHLPRETVSSLEEGNRASSLHCPERVRGDEWALLLTFFGPPELWPNPARNYVRLTIYIFPTLHAMAEHVFFQALGSVPPWSWGLWKAATWSFSTAVLTPCSSTTSMTRRTWLERSLSSAQVSFPPWGPSPVRPRPPQPAVETVSRQGTFGC